MIPFFVFKVSAVVNTLMTPRSRVAWFTDWDSQVPLKIVFLNIIVKWLDFAWRNRQSTQRVLFSPKIQGCNRRIYQKNEVSHFPGGWLALLHTVMQGSRILITGISNSNPLVVDSIQMVDGEGPGSRDTTALHVPCVQGKDRTSLSISEEECSHTSTMKCQRDWSVLVKTKQNKIEQFNWANSKYFICFIQGFLNGASCRMELWGGVQNEDCNRQKGRERRRFS